MITCYAARGYLYTEPSRTSWKVRFKINESHANSVIIKSYKNLSHKKECIGGPKASSPHKRKKEIQRTKKQIGKCWQNFKKYTNGRLNRSSVIIETTISLIEVIVNYDKWNISTERIALCWYNRKSEMIHRKGNTQSKVSKIFTY